MLICSFSALIPLSFGKLCSVSFLFCFSFASDFSLDGAISLWFTVFMSGCKSCSSCDSSVLPHWLDVLHIYCHYIRLKFAYGFQKFPFIGAYM